MSDSIFCGECASNILGLPPPNAALAISTTNQVFLVIYRSEEHITSESGCEYDRCAQRRQLDGVPCKILRLQCVNCWKPYYGAPGQVEAKVVVAHVNGTEVPGDVSELREICVKQHYQSSLIKKSST